MFDQDAALADRDSILDAMGEIAEEYEKQLATYRAALEEAKVIIRLQKTFLSKRKLHNPKMDEWLAKYGGLK